MSTIKILSRCTRCGDTYYAPPGEQCICGGFYVEMNKHDTIAYEQAKRRRVLDGIENSENRAARGSVIFPTGEPDYSLIPDWLKEQNDDIRVRYGVRPRWRDES